METSESCETSVEQFLNWYGSGEDGCSPTGDQWREVLSRPAGDGLTLINYFKLRATAVYGERFATSDDPISGEEAFNRYAAVSIPTMERVGGKFLLVGQYDSTFLGDDEDWDVVAIGTYPDKQAFLALYGDENYRAAFQHRSAACARQKVIVCSG